MEQTPPSSQAAPSPESWDHSRGPSGVVVVTRCLIVLVGVETSGTAGEGTSVWEGCHTPHCFVKEPPALGVQAVATHGTGCGLLGRGTRGWQGRAGMGDSEL